MYSNEKENMAIFRFIRKKIPESRRTADFVYIHGKYICTLMKFKCNITFFYQDYLGDTPIHKAAKRGNMECVSLLISQGASLW